MVPRCPCEQGSELASFLGAQLRHCRQDGRPSQKGGQCANRRGVSIGSSRFQGDGTVWPFRNHASDEEALQV
eukprot:g46288.t1